MNKLTRSAIAGAVGIASLTSMVLPSLAFADNAVAYHLTYDSDTDGSNLDQEIDAPSGHGLCDLFGTDPANHKIIAVQAVSGFDCDGTYLRVANLDPTAINGLSNKYSQVDSLTSNLALATSTLGTLNTTVASLSVFSSILTSYIPTMLGVANNLSGASTTMLVSTSSPGFMSAADKTKLNGLDTTGLVKVQRTRVTTDGSGNYTWTFPTAYASGQAPIVSVIAEDSSGALSNVQITAISNTSVTVHAGKITSALGILALASNASVPVDITAVPQ